MYLSPFIILEKETNYIIVNRRESYFWEIENREKSIEIVTWGAPLGREVPTKFWVHLEFRRLKLLSHKLRGPDPASCDFYVMIKSLDQP